MKNVLAVIREKPIDKYLMTDFISKSKAEFFTKKEGKNVISGYLRINDKVFKMFVSWFSDSDLSLSGITMDDAFNYVENVSMDILGKYHKEINRDTIMLIERHIKLKSPA